jgi:hypothetical protein
MAKQFAFDEAGRDGSAVDLDERPIPARTQVVNCTRNEFFTCSCFSKDQCCGNGGGDDPNPFAHTAYNSASTYNPCEIDNRNVFFKKCFSLRGSN